jgi:Domain of Unknown Function (DUF1080)/FG-GAP-like repeat
MKPNRRQFLALASTAGAWVPLAQAAAKLEPSSLSPAMGAGQGNITKTSASAPLSLFDGTSLSGWRVQGPAQWRVENGALLGSCDASGGGWLLTERGFQDFVLRFAFRSTSGEAGVLLRNAPLSWSRFSHAKDAGERTMGVYVALSGVHAGEMSLLTLDGHGKQIDHKPIPAPVHEARGSGDEIYPGMCAPIPCSGINDAEATKAGWPSHPSIHFTTRSDGWQQVEITLRGSACPWDTTGVAEALEARSQFGTLALFVSGAPVHFKELLLFDLTQRAAGLAQNANHPRFHQMTDLFYAEGVAAGDLNQDGYDEVVAGPFYYLGPDYTMARELYPPATINLAGVGEHGNYSNCFLSHIHDFTGDGWPDVLMIMGFGPRPSFSAHLFVNPRGELRHWDNYNVVPSVSSETTQLFDIDGDGHPELIYAQNDQVGYAKPDASDPTKPWLFYPVSEKAPRAPHGLGVGDVNGDGRLDIVTASGWWEQPPAGTKGLWKFHPVPFGASEGEPGLRGGADIFVYDVNGDGVPDVITSLNAHGPGLAWFEQQRDPQGDVTWKRHLIMGDPSTPLAEREPWEETDKSVAFTELHALAFANLDGDELPSIITGKRWWSHGYIYDENDVDNPPVLYRFQLVRKSGGAVEWIPSLIHNASGVGTQIVAKDINRDGRIEIVTTARKGTFVFHGPFKI